MTTIRTTAHSRQSTSPFLSGLGATAYCVVADAWKTFVNRRAVRRLADLDDYMLADIGLTRMDVDLVGTLPIHADPSLHLAATAGMRGTGEMIVHPAIVPGRRLP